MPCIDPRGFDIRGDRVIFCFLGWRSVADSMDALRGFAIRVDIRILGLAVEVVPWTILWVLAYVGSVGFSVSWDGGS